MPIRINHRHRHAGLAANRHADLCPRLVSDANGFIQQCLHFRRLQTVINITGGRIGSGAGGITIKVSGVGKDKSIQAGAAAVSKHQRVCWPNSGSGLAKDSALQRSRAVEITRHRDICTVVGGLDSAETAGTVRSTEQV